MMLIAAENSRSNFVWDVFAQSSTARQALAAAFPSIAPALVGAVSRKIGPGSVARDVPVNLSSEGLSIEARQGGPTQLVLSFGANVVQGPNFSVSLSSGNVTSTSFSGSTLTINLSGATDAQRLVVNVSDVRHFSNTAAGNYTFSLGVLLADATHDGAVNLLDFNALAGNFGTAATSDAQGDFNFDGTVDLIDFNLLAGQFGKTLAASSTPGAFATQSLVGSPRASFSSIPIARIAHHEDDRSASALLDSTYVH